MNRRRALREKTEAASYSEVPRNALRLYEALIEAAEVPAEKFVVRRKNREPGEAKVFLS